MEKEVKLVKKVSGLLKQLNCRGYLHHFGPKKFKFKQHASALLLKEVCKMSFRRVSNILSMLGLAVPTYSALCKMRKRIPACIWEKMLKISSGMRYQQVAIDGTGFSRTNPSYHYVKRINRRKPVKSYAKLSALFDTKKKKFCTIRVRTKPRHDIKDASYLLRRTEVQKTLFGDTGYDAKWLRELCYQKKIQPQIKPRKNTTKRNMRKIIAKGYCEKKYHQRSLIESGFGSLKRKYGSSVSGKSIASVRPEIYCKAIAHNLGLCC
jgi:transposase